MLSASINKYCYVISRYLPPFFDCNYRIRYSKYEETKTIAEIEHPSVRECLNHLEFNEGVEIQHNTDVPGMSGLGSSSSFTVGLLNSLYALRGQEVSKLKLALDAIHVEQKRIGENVGSQDQAIAAFGGLNQIRFGGKDDVAVKPLDLPRERMQELEKHLALFFTGFPRNASEVAAEQIKNTPHKVIELKALHALVDEATQVLVSPKESVERLGRLLHEGWRLKKSLSSKITNPFIDEVYEAAMHAGALGGKILGAGGGGFMLIFVKPELRDKVQEALAGLLEVPFKFEFSGSQVIYRMPQDEL